MHRALVALGIAVAVTLPGCSRKGSPEDVADAFTDAYFRRMDQEKAKEYTALGASEMLDRELGEVADIRKDGYTPSDASGDVSIHRGEATRREQRVRIPYQITVKVDGTEHLKDADVELTQIQGTWKVVRLGLSSK